VGFFDRARLLAAMIGRGYHPASSPRAPIG
jgi:hypothetical protein